MVKTIAFSLLTCLFTFSLTTFAQETTAGIQGTVKDAQGGVIPAATVGVTSPALIGKKSVSTDAGGFYHIEQLPPGVYMVNVTAPGMSPQTQSNLRLDTGT